MPLQCIAHVNYKKISASLSNHNIPYMIIGGQIETFVKQTMVLPTMEEKTGIRVDFIFSFTPYEMEAIKRVKAIEAQLKLIEAKKTP